MSASRARLGIAGICIVTAAAVLVFAARTAWAAWMVFPAPLLSPALPTNDIARLEAAAAAAPGEATYPFHLGRLYQARFREHWLQQDAAEWGRKAWQSALRARELVPANPFFQRLAGSASLELASHPSTPAAERDALVAAGVGYMDEAIAGGRYSPLLQQQAGLELIRFWRQVGDRGHEMAPAALRQAASLDPGTLRTSLENAWNLEPRAPELGLLLGIAPQTPEAQRYLAVFLEERARLFSGMDPALSATLSGESLDAYRRAAELADLDLDALSRWGSAHRRLDRQRPERFLAAVQEIVAAHPERPEAWLGLSEARAMVGDIGGTEEALTTAVSRAHGAEPRVAAQVRARQGDFYFDRRDYRAALDAYSEISPGLLPDPRPLLRTARSLEALQQPDEALAAAETAVRWFPASIEARRELARAYVERQAYSRAVGQWKAIIARAPEDLEAHVQIGRAYEALGVRDQAIPYYTRALELAPEGSSARQEIRDALRRLSAPSR